MEMSSIENKEMPIDLRVRTKLKIRKRYIEFEQTPTSPPKITEQLPKHCSRPISRPFEQKLPIYLSLNAPLQPYELAHNFQHPFFDASLNVKLSSIHKESPPPAEPSSTITSPDPSPNSSASVLPISVGMDKASEEYKIKRARNNEAARKSRQKKRRQEESTHRELEESKKKVQEYEQLLNQIFRSVQQCHRCSHNTGITWLPLRNSITGSSNPNQNLSFLSSPPALRQPVIDEF